VGSSERKEREKTIREDDIVDAAERVFFARGFDGATMDDVAREADFSKRTLYKYFSSKNQLMLAIAYRGFLLLNAMMRNTASGLTGGRAADRLAAIGRTYLEFRNRHLDHFRTIVMYETQDADFAEDDLVARKCYAEGEKVADLLAATIRDGIRDKSLRADLEPEETALVLWAELLGLNILLDKKAAYLRRYRRMKPEGLVDAMFRHILRSIATTKGKGT
jgi:AcrR family transcriptional regulator